VAFVIESLHVVFHSFIDPNYPVRIRVEDVRSAEMRSSGENAESGASFYQSNKLAAVATMRANIIKDTLFKRLQRQAARVEQPLPAGEEHRQGGRFRVDHS
jgi:hypothetical protein